MLEEAIHEILERSQRLGVRLSLEPEPGHWVQSLAGYDRLRTSFPNLLLTLDVCHVSVCCEEGTAQDAVETYRDYLGLVHIEDAPRGVHAHLPLGEGELNLPAILSALQKIEFQGLCAVELSRHSHSAHQMVPKTMNILKSME